MDNNPPAAAAPAASAAAMRAAPRPARGLVPRSVPVGLLYASLLSLPLSMDVHSGRLGAGLLLLAEPLLVLTVLAGAVHLLTARPAWPRPVMLDRLVAVHFAALAVATAFSPAWLVSAKFFSTLLLYALAGYALPRLLGFSRGEWYRAFGAFGIGAAALAVYVFGRYWQAGITHPVSYSIAQPFLEHGHTNLTVVLEPALLFGTLLVLYNRLRGGPWLAVLASVVVVAAVIAFTYSRASYVSLLVQGLVLLGYGTPLARGRLLRLAVLGLGLTFASWQTIDLLHPIVTAKDTATIVGELKTVSNFTPQNSSNAERLSRWRVALELWQDEPTAGLGPGTFPDRYLDYVRGTPGYPIYDTTLLRMNTHNLYLGWLTDAGLLGVLSGLALLGYVLQRQLRQTLRRPTPELVGMSAYFLYFLLHSVVQDFWQEPRVIVVFWLVLGFQREIFRTRKPRRPVAAPST